MQIASSTRRLVAVGLAVACALAGPLAFAGEEEDEDDAPLAGFAGDTAFLRSRDNNFILFPNGRLQVDGYFYARPTGDMPNDTVLLKRARLELAGWVGPWFYYTIAGDFAAAAPAPSDPQPQNFIAATDDYITLAPHDDWALLQVGQFDAPFTFENRTSDKYFDFMERSITVRSFGIPTNKEVGLMLHGTPKDRLFYYSLAALNGDGQNFKNVDADADIMGRFVIWPLALSRVSALDHLGIGGSFWHGTRGTDGLAAFPQTTQAGFKFFDTKWTLPDGKTPAELHQNGTLNTFAFEANVPVMHRFGFRFEYVRKTQQFGEDDITNAASDKLVVLGRAKLDGWSAYGELWAWILGNDRMLPEPATQFPTRLASLETKAPKHGVMLAARLDSLHETMTTDTRSLADPAIGTTDVLAPEIGINYWYSKRFRATFNYALNLISGSAPNVESALKKNGNDKGEHEFLFRLAVAL